MSAASGDAHEESQLRPRVDAGESADAAAAAATAAAARTTTHRSSAHTASQAVAPRSPSSPRSNKINQRLPTPPPPSSPSLSPRPPDARSPKAIPRASPFAPRLDERDSIFATHYDTIFDDRLSANRSQHAEPTLHRPASHSPDLSLRSLTPGKPSSASYDGVMAAAATAAPATSVRHLPETAFVGEDLDLSANISFLSKLKARNPAVTSLYRHRDSIPKHFAQSEILPDHLIALPPLSTPSSSPRNSPSTPKYTTDKNFDLSEQDSDERLAYRFWREGRPVRSGRLMNDDGHFHQNPDSAIVDKKIQAQLPRAEQTSNARSRKTSHVLGIFKEPEASPSQSLPRIHEPSIPEEGKREEQEDQASVQTATQSADTKKVLAGDAARRPAATLNQARDTTHGMKLPAGVLTPDPVPTEHFGSVPTLIKSVSAPEELRTDSNAYSPPTEAEDQEKETISKAVYFPHRPARRQAEPSQRSSSSTDRNERDRFRGNRDDADAPKFFSQHGPEHARPEQPQGIEISLQLQNQNQYLHGDIPFATPVSQPTAPLKTPVNDREAFLSESEGDVSADEDVDPPDGGTVTPRPDEKPAEYLPTAPYSIELKPFSHQVGGHTAVYRFSRHAICKKLNNKENKFYETVERYHPELSKFLPRYIGVLNITFEKSKSKTVSRRRSRRHKADGEDSPLNSTEDPKINAQPRIVSHSQAQAIEGKPRAYADLNRHIIPNSIFPASPRYSPPQSDLPRRARTPDIAVERSTVASPLDFHPRPSSHHGPVWGATTVNRDLQERVFSEVFLPPVIHRFQKRRSTRLTRIETASSSHLRQADPAATAGNPLSPPIRGRDADRDVYWSDKLRSPDASHQDVPGIASGLPSTGPQSYGLEEGARKVDSSRSRSRAIRRRHSGSGLRRTQRDVDSHLRSELQFYTNIADEHEADADEMFSMDKDRRASHSIQPLPKAPPSSASGGGSIPSSPDGAEGSDPYHSMLPAAAIDEFGGSSLDENIPLNPKEARSQATQRAEEFLLLEDLTAGMRKPCTLDIKMGTRQYGIDADEKKQKSQRSKCRSTTSKELGVRVCGMQTYDVVKREVLWEDKYWGRDLQAGKELKAALAKFFFDGVNYSAAKRLIPPVLEKIGALEQMVRTLPGYRFYGSSLYIIYDGGCSPTATPRSDHNQRKLKRAGSSDSPSTSGDGTSPPAPDEEGEIVVKIIDFANCVTAKDTNLIGARCPPHHPDDVDRGYLRGLRTLNMYFRQIWNEMNQDGRFVERGEGEAMASGMAVLEGRGAEVVRGVVDVEDDPGEISV